VILLDEVEKAHPEVMNVLLQLLDDGRLTDGKGRVVDFRNTLVVMTSNLAQDERFAPRTDEDGMIDESPEQRRERQRAITAELQLHFRPEFLNRLDAIVRFNGLTRELIRRIVHLELAKVNRILGEQDLELVATDAAVERIAELGFDPQFGARPVKRVIQREVQDRLADLILAGDAGPDTVVTLDVSAPGEGERPGELVLEPAQSARASQAES
jgi:ATP-dependent Clp protease ATP-binding subunit ClpA